ncbi:MAG: flagellar protein FlgN [Acidimicrobiia bacterium]|nr:flagellar protein FlgN [Acidimicrobiia bacterium]
MSFNEISNTLWHERQLLELLLFKLEEEQLVLASGRTRWLTHATREVETVLAEIKRAELGRAVEVEAVAPELGLTHAPSLQQLVEHAPEPWSRIFEEHRKALLELAGEIDGLAQANRELLTRGQQAARDALRALTEGVPDTYSPHGVSSGVRGSLGLVNEAI